MTDSYFMKLAIGKAKTGIKKGQTPFSACIVKNGKVVSCAHNLVWKNTDITAHAEINAIRQACKKLKSIDLSGCVIYSTCEPCPMCFSAIHWAKIYEIIYGTTINDAKKLGFNELTVSNRKLKSLGKSPLKIRGSVCRKENLALFNDWKKLNGEKIY
ncbi:MAG: tRNA-specific adenosine deaminase [Omnitrophica bacterium RIFCSPLOWO2_12_FULL_44_17]|uniref:tRNA-specific adenosine deaminase n=1 Tax=Candidatus Danuiimicrobium aquiferis TaxID=1801832 RepID=A0A1G1L312_9BACT|nr:MAG: tRNA-specific adenosine deaminase [Omnitrophica bacterium RIFCSPHIGHO2_02_FULL_45_28]OGW92428.1 MAG: tRNA-specific adenosine deaminase [Omnitrophica bacterium RIFCSPHIGHO2_12_FULL_44_12]OGW99517.1 MAG: tRNA-specific adenosine deaminase [Omnitrophica bacterium RIFCSPLOWO2_12_FULL_44_17]OGX02689.1 MAG: tRNA-specific adenosine deaminase [Omnitrophica bacterium RIFCSPLOWO2_02_FULL_44_11]